MKDMRDSAAALRKGGLTISELDGEVLIYDPEARRASCLNSFAAEVLSLCDGRRSVSEIARDMAANDVDERLVWVALTDLRKAELLQGEGPAAPDEVVGTRRRDLLKRIGAGAAMAAPIVAGIAVPSAAQAASCIGLGQSCGTGKDLGKQTCCAGLQCTGSDGFKHCN